MNAVDIPPPEIAGIYAGSMVVFLALLSASRQRTSYSLMYILAPSIRLFILFGIAGCAAVVWAMISGRASTDMEQVLVMTAFSLGAVTQVAKEWQLCNLEWNYDLFGAVAWANLIATNREARQVEQHLATASAHELSAELRVLYVRLVASSTITLPPSWLRVLYFFFLYQTRTMTEADVASTAGSARSSQGREPRQTPNSSGLSSTRSLGGRVRRLNSVVASFVRGAKGVFGSWNPRSVFFGVTRGCLLVSALPLFIVFAVPLVVQYVRALWTLSYKVEPRLARHMASCWLWNSLLGPPALLPVSGAWSLWMLSAAINEGRAAELIRAMTCPPGLPVTLWTLDDARGALGNTCGANRYRSGRPPRSRTWRVVSWILFLPVNQWRRAFPTNRELYFKFTLSALNIHATLTDDHVALKDPCTLDDAINGNVAALSELYRRLGGVVLERWVEVEEHLVSAGVIGASSPVGNVALPHPPNGLDPEEGGGGTAVSWSGHTDKAPLSDPPALLRGAAPADGSVLLTTAASVGGAPPD
ncbi:hypothetical protein MMPV_006433 [Pyropia vietnamensis]